MRRGCDLANAFYLLYMYDYKLNLCSKRSEITSNHENWKVLSIKRREARHRQYKKPTLGDGQAYGQSSDYAAAVTYDFAWKVWTDRELTRETFRTLNGVSYVRYLYTAKAKPIHKKQQPLVMENVTWGLWLQVSVATCPGLGPQGTWRQEEQIAVNRQS
jgi:hypothetical protein